MSEIFRQRNAHRIVGISLFLMFLIILGSVVVLLQKNEVFSKHVIYYLEAEQSQLRGLRKSTDIRILGEPVGTVKDIAYIGNSNRVQLELKVKIHADPRKNIVWENSRIIVSRSLGIGERFLEIERGKDTLGAIVSNTSERDFERMRAENGKFRGVRIERLIDNSPAKKAGLAYGQVITQFNSQPINGIEDLYKAMSGTAPGDAVALTIFGEPEPVSLIAEMVEPRRLEEGGVIIQVQPEVDTLREFSDRLGLVQESIESVENSIVSTLNKTELDIDTSLKPTIDQYLKTGESVQQTSDSFRLETLGQLADTLESVNKSSEAFNAQIESVASQIGEVTTEKIAPAVEHFADASISIEKTSETLSSTSRQIGKDTSELIEDLRKTTDSLNDLLKQSQNIASALESEAQTLPGTVRGFNETLEKADTLIDGVSNHWLLRKSVENSRVSKGQSTPSSKRLGPVRGLLKGRKKRFQ